MKDTRKKLSEDLGIPLEDASRMIIEKEKSLTQSEIKYHLKSVCGLLDKLRQTDSDFSETVAKEAIKFLIARHASMESIQEIGAYLDHVSENFLEKAIVDRINDDY